MIAGMTTNHCISTTVRMSANLGYKTFLVHDAAASFDTKGMNGEVYSAELVHAVAIANLKDEFADVVSTDEVIEALR